MAGGSETENGGEPQALIHEIYKAWTPNQGEKKSWAAFARFSRVSEYSLTEWRSGRGSPSAVNLLRMLEAVGWLQREAQQPAAVPVAPISLMAEALQNQRTMQEDLRQLADAVKLMAADLRAVTERIEELAASSESQRRQA